MTFEVSHGKVRPTLPRASDLEAPEAEAKPTAGRGAHGHFAGANRIGLEARFVHTVRKALGSGDATGAALVVARDARRVFAHVLRSLPSDAAPVRALLAVYARHQALHAYFTLKAEATGLDTPKGLSLLAVADRQSQRAERTLVTCHDLARVHADLAKKPGAGGKLAPWYRDVPDDDTKATPAPPKEPTP
jgi:hypothetical protein